MKKDTGMVTGITPRLPPHESRIDHARFFASVFGGVRPARAFHDSLGGREREPRHTALLIINQTARLLHVADKVHRVSRGRPALQIMFFVFAAEAISKLFEGYNGEGDSRKHVRRFYLSMCTDAHRRRLIRSLRSTFPRLSTADEMADQLYSIRCDVAHRWKYYSLHLSDDAVHELRAIVLEGAALAARTLASRKGAGRE